MNIISLQHSIYLFCNVRGADKDYLSPVVDRAKRWFNQLDETGRKQLKETILLGLPGSLKAYSLDELKRELAAYAHVNTSQLREHLKFFLGQIVPVAEANDIKLAIHPDDPPWPLMGLPRIVSTADDLDYIINCIPSSVNGIALCTGSLGAGYFNNLADMAEKFAPKVNFAHLRNVSRTEESDFWENNFFEGDVDMIKVTTHLLKEMMRRKNSGEKKWQIPMRPDHGYQMLGDIGQENYPGYGLYGRMKNLAEFRGLEMGILHHLTE